jgi:hypothetical protein
VQVLQEKAAVELDLKDVKASLREAQAKEDVRTWPIKCVFLA